MGDGSYLYLSSWRKRLASCRTRVPPDRPTVVRRSERQRLCGERSVTGMSINGTVGKHERQPPKQWEEINAVDEDGTAICTMAARANTAWRGWGVGEVRWAARGTGVTVWKRAPSRTWMAGKVDHQTYGYGLRGKEDGWVSQAGPSSLSLSRTPQNQERCAPPVASDVLTGLRREQRASPSPSQPSVMCRIVLERGRSQQGEPKGPKDAGFEQGRKSVDFRAVPASPTHFQRLSM